MLETRVRFVKRSVKTNIYYRCAVKTSNYENQLKLIYFTIESNTIYTPET